jgi:hypothetical protein
MRRRITKMMMKVDSRKLTFEEKEIVEHDTYRVS